MTEPSTNGGQRKRRIAIFQSHYRMHSNLVYAAQMFVAAGFGVDLFLYKVHNTIVGDTLDKASDIKLHVLDASPAATAESAGTAASAPVAAPSVPPGASASAKKLARGAYRNLPGGLQRLAMDSYVSVRSNVDETFGLFPSMVFRYALEQCRHHSYQAFIGVEKGGLMWAGRVASRTGTPLIYFSLELYTRDHPFLVRPEYRRLKRAEEKYHRRSAATIIQDVHRGRALVADNGVSPDMRMLYVPVSRQGGPITAEFIYLSTKLGYTAGTVLILNHGMISEHRLSCELARVAQSFPENWRMVFHGWGADEVIAKIRGLDLKGRVGLSLDLLPLAREAEIVRSAHVSLVIYDKQTINDRLTGFASEKIALSLQCGVPVIAFKYEGYDHIVQEHCGVLIESLQDLPAAVDVILKDYAAYRAGAYACFTKYYSFEKNFAKVVEMVDGLA
jgi:glycosyltransferase involved in cell wall biosynthesis